MCRHPYPRNRRVDHCIFPTQADPADAARAFARWREEIVTAHGAHGGFRTRRPDTPDGQADSSVSEGIAYGLIIAVMFDDQPLFDGFWKYAEHFTNERGLMNWYIAPDGSRALGSGGATDADEDMAWALVMAHRQWGGGGSLAKPYLSLALRQIEAVWEFEVDHDAHRHMLLPGDGWRGRDVFNPSCFAPNQYRVFAEVSGNPGWLDVVNRGYEIVEASLNPENGNRENGLVPAWCDSSGTPVEAFRGALTNYQYDSARLPFRIGQDWMEFRDARARRYLERVSAFFAGVGADSIVDGYTLTGQPAPDPRATTPNPGSAVFVGSAAVGAMHDARYQSFVDAAYTRVRTGELLARSRYYNHCWTVLSLLMLTGNLQTIPE